jgi:hypothetical protein
LTNELEKSYIQNEEISRDFEEKAKLIKEDLLKSKLVNINLMNKTHAN